MTNTEYQLPDMSATAFPSGDVNQRVEQASSTPEAYRIAKMEGWKLQIVANPNALETTIQWLGELPEHYSENARALRDEQLQRFESKLDLAISRMTKDKSEFEYPRIGEQFYPVQTVNERLDKEGLGAMRLPESITPEQIRQMARLRYALETGLIHQVTAGYVATVMDMWHKEGFPKANIVPLLRDGRVFAAAAKGLAHQNEQYGLQQEAGNPDSGKVQTSFLNSAVIAPLAQDQSRIYTTHKGAITYDDAMAYLRQTDVIGEEGSTPPLTVFLDTAAMGTMPVSLKEAIGEKGNIAMICFSGGPLTNKNIPAYTSYVTTGSWFDREDPEARMAGSIIHAYAEDHFAHCLRPEHFERYEQNPDRLGIPIELANDATTLLSWVSLQAAQDTGEAHGLMRKEGGSVVEGLPSDALDRLYAWWTQSVENPQIPNIAFGNWPPGHENRKLETHWPNALESLPLPVNREKLNRKGIQRLKEILAPADGSAGMVIMDLDGSVKEASRVQAWPDGEARNILPETVAALRVLHEKGIALGVNTDQPSTEMIPWLRGVAQLVAGKDVEFHEVFNGLVSAERGNLAALVTETGELEVVIRPTVELVDQRDQMYKWLDENVVQVGGDWGILSGIDPAIATHADFPRDHHQGLASLVVWGKGPDMSSDSKYVAKYGAIKQRLEEGLVEAQTSSLEVDLADNGTFRILAKGSTKARPLEIGVERSFIRPENTVCVVDGPQDVAMASYLHSKSGGTITVSNGVEEIHPFADYVANEPAGKGFATAIATMYPDEYRVAYSTVMSESSAKKK